MYPEASRQLPETHETRFAVSQSAHFAFSAQFRRSSTCSSKPRFAFTRCLSSTPSPFLSTRSRLLPLRPRRWKPPQAMRGGTSQTRCATHTANFVHTRASICTHRHLRDQCELCLGYFAPGSAMLDSGLLFTLHSMHRSQRRAAC